MRTKKYFNTNSEKVKNKDHNIFIPICLGNKFFTKKTKPTNNLIEYYYWALQHTKEKVLFIIVDDIQLSNYLVRSSTSSESQSKRRIKRESNAVKINIEQIIKGNTQTKVIQWKDYEEEDPYCSKTSHILYKEFKDNTTFREYIIQTVKTSVTDRPFSEKKYFLLANYILDEFSLCYSGLQYKGTTFDLFPYPKSDSALEFISNIQQKQIFPKLYEKLPKQKTGIVLRT